MNQYKATGTRYYDYYTVVTAETREAALAIAQGDDIDWFEIESDNVVEDIDVSLVEDGD